MGRLFSIELLLVTTAVVCCASTDRDGEACKSGLQPNMDGVWMCEQSWLVATVPPLDGDTNATAARLRLMSDGSDRTEVVLPPIDGAIRSLIFKLPDFYVLRAARLKFDTASTPMNRGDGTFSIHAWNDTTSETPNGGSGSNYWMKMSDATIGDNQGATVQMGNLSRLSK